MRQPGCDAGHSEDPQRSQQQGRGSIPGAGDAVPAPGVLTVAAAFFRRGLQEALSYRAAFGLRLVTVLVSLGSFFYLGRFVDTGRSPLLAPYGGDYVSFALVGMILLHLQHVAVAAHPQAIREAQLTGTLEAMLATPTPPHLVLVCAPLFRLGAAFLWAAVYLGAGMLLFGVRLGPVCWTSLLLSLPLCLVAFTSLGFLGAAMTMLLRRSDPISYFLSGLSALAGGVLYPTTVLPTWLRAAGRALPLTHALEVVRRSVFAGANPHQLAPPLVALALICALFAPLGLLAFAASVRQARRDGSLTHF